MKNRKIISKKAVVPALLVSLLLTACSTQGQTESSSASEAPASASAAETDKLEKTQLQLGYLNSTAHLLAFVAKEEGYFADEGLDVTLTQFTNATELSSGLESNKLDVALIGSFATVTLQSNSHPLTIFGGAMTNGHGFVIKPEYTEGLDSWDVSILKGKNVAVAKNNTDDLELQLLLKQEGIAIGEGDDEVNVVYFDSQKDAYAAIANQNIDACSVYSPYASLAKGTGYEVVYYDADIDLFRNLPCCRQVTTDTQIAESPNTYTAFERAMIRAYHFSQENHDGTIADVAKYIDIDKDYINTEIYGGYSTSSPDPDKQGTVSLKESAVSSGFVEDYDIEPHYNTDIFKNALDQVIEQNPDDEIYQSLKTHFDTYE